jgi:glycosyltransferase involved in cell wall biosynthesis
MSARLRILQVTPELDSGGVERTTIEVAEAITAAGGKALVASAGGRLEQDLAHVGGELIRMDLASKNPVTILANAQRLAHLAEVREVGLIHARSRAPGWSALWAARKTGLPFVTTYHGIYNAGGPMKRWYNSVMARGDVVIANSNFTREHVLSQHDVPSERVIAIPRAVDLEQFDPGAVAPARVDALRSAWNLPSDRLVALAPARLSRWKGQDLLIEAAAIAEAKAPGRLVYVLAGDPQGRDAYVGELQAAIAKAGLQDVVRLSPHYISDMPAAFTAADFAIFPPTSLEAFGRAAVEAQAMGVPVIAADQGGFSETVVRDKTGLLFPIGEAAALADAIVRMAAMSADDRRAMGEAGAKRARALYSKQALQSATLDVYRKLLQESAA